MHRDLEGLTVVVSGPTQAVARFQAFMQQFDQAFSLQAGEGACTGADGLCTARWSTSRSARVLRVRGPRSRKVGT